MISVLTLTYQRHHLLEEAIQSFLNQDYTGECEMVILNDSPEVIYKYNHPKVRIINYPQRFSSIGKKLEYGFSQCKGDYIYRLDDDDLLTPWALSIVAQYITNDAEIFRCNKSYYLCQNEYQGITSNVNNGNCYKKSYTDRIIIPDISIGEDVEVTFKTGAKIYTGDVGKYSMIYRWGMNTFHISSLGVEHSNNSKYLFEQIDKNFHNEHGVIVLNPHFNLDYYSMLPHHL